MRALALVLLLLSSSVFAQVAGVCGSGKNCSVATLRTTAVATPSVCSTGSNADWGTQISTSNYSIYSYTAGTRCSSGGVVKLNVNINDAAVRTGTAGWFSASAGFESSVAFASFPTAASSSGRLIYDSTNAVWRYSNGTVWAPLEVGVVEYLSVYVPANVVTNNPVNQWAWAAPTATPAQNTTVTLESVTVLTTGVGAGNITYTIYNATAGAATTATVTIGCTTAVGTVTAGSADNTLISGARTMQVRVTASACATNPVVNLTARTLHY
jgi:hypothetical protein